MKKSLFTIFAVVQICSLMLLPGRVFAAAGSASLSLSPACGPVYNTKNLTVDIHEDSGSEAINAVQSDLTYSSSQFDVISVTVATGWSEVQNDTSTPGTILFAAFPSPPGASVTGDQKVATVVFQAKTGSGAASVTFANSSAVVAASDNTNILSSSTGGKYPQGFAHSCGSLVKSSSSSTVYIIADGAKRPIPSSQVFSSNGYSWNNITSMTAADLALTTGSALPFRDGTLIKGSSPNVYVVDNSSGSSQKRLISSYSVFVALGYTSSDILSVSDSQLPASNGTAISNSTTHPVGTLVKSSNNPNIYLLGSGLKQLFPNQYVFTSNGYMFNKVKTATSADLALTSGLNMSLRAGTLIKGSTSSVYVVDVVSGVAQKRHITSINIFNYLGYNSSQIVTIPDSVLPSINGLDI